MTKNIRVTDESGRDYGCTYPRRAKGLVKNGRARFVDENVICLACPPNQSQTNDLEEALMFDKKETPVNPNTNFNNDPGFPPPAVDPQQSVPQQPIPMAGGAPQDCSPVDISSEYILNQIEAIRNDTAYLTDAIRQIGELIGNNSPATDCRAQAIGDIVKAREETNRQMLVFYTNLFYWQYPEAKPEQIGDERSKQSYELKKHALSIAESLDLDGNEFAEVLARILNMN